jgi:hypothetical protein
MARDVDLFPMPAIPALFFRLSDLNNWHVVHLLFPKHAEHTPSLLLLEGNLSPHSKQYSSFSDEVSDRSFFSSSPAYKIILALSPEPCFYVFSSTIPLFLLLLNPLGKNKINHMVSAERMNVF